MSNETATLKPDFWKNYTNWIKGETHFFFIKQISRLWTIAIGITFFSLLSMAGDGSFFESVLGTSVWAFILSLIAFAWQQRKKNTTTRVINKTTGIFSKLLVYGLLLILAFTIFILIFTPKA